jgi:uncharacterized protein (DUF2164 family)
MNLDQINEMLGDLVVGQGDVMGEAKQDSFVTKIKNMSDAERKRLGPREKIKFKKLQYALYANKIADQVSKSVNSEAKRMGNLVTWNLMSGKLEPFSYPAQGLLEAVIMELEDRV